MRLSTLERDRRAKDRFYWMVSEAQLADKDSCWIWRGTVNDGGYGKFLIGDKQITAHRYSYKLHTGEIPEGMQVCHTCDMPRCVNPRHLFLGTNMENVLDKMAKKRHQFGISHICAKLTEEQVIDIKKDGRSHEKIGKHYGVSHGTISAIKRGKTWKHVL